MLARARFRSVPGGTRTCLLTGHFSVFFVLYLIFLGQSDTPILTLLVH